MQVVQLLTRAHANDIAKAAANLAKHIASSKPRLQTFMCLVQANLCCAEELAYHPYSA